MLKRNTIVCSLICTLLMGQAQAGISRWLPWPFAPKLTKTELVMQWFNGQITTIKNVIPTIVRNHPKLSVGIAAGTLLSSYLVGTTLYNRYILLPSIAKKLQPSVSDKEHRIYNWGLQEFDTAVKTCHYSSYLLINLIKDCSQLTIYSARALQQAKVLVPLKGPMYWRDLLATIDYELDELEKMAALVQSSAEGIIGGVRADYEAMCSERGISDESQISWEQECAIDHAMQAKAQNLTMQDRLDGLLHANVNYDVAYAVYWRLYKRILRMRALRILVHQAAQQYGHGALITGYCSIAKAIK